MNKLYNTKIVIKNIANHISEKIKDDIIDGVIKSGEIITERSLEQRYGVSRTPIRTALKFLEREGWVDVTPRQETRVTSFGAAEYKEALLIRQHTELLALKFAMQNVSSEDVKKLKDMSEELDVVLTMVETDVESSLQRYNDVDRRFHGALYGMSNCRMLCRIHSCLQALFLRTYRLVPLDRHRITSGASEIKRVIDSILDRDLISAEMVLSEHLINSTHHKLLYLNEQEKGNNKKNQETARRI